MKLTKTQLKEMIREEIRHNISLTQFARSLDDAMGFVDHVKASGDKTDIDKVNKILKNFKVDAWIIKK